MGVAWGPIFQNKTTGLWQVEKILECMGVCAFMGDELFGHMIKLVQMNKYNKQLLLVN